MELNKLAFGFFLVSLSCLAEKEPSSATTPQPNDVLDTAPKIVLHDILTDRVCIYDNKVFGPGSKVRMDGVLYECINTNPNGFSEKKDWTMEWVLFNSDQDHSY